MCVCIHFQYFSEKSFAGEKGIVTGWGVKQPSKARRGVSTTLQELEVPIMSNDECKETGYDQKQITDNMLCAGFKEGGKDSCQVKMSFKIHHKKYLFVITPIDLQEINNRRLLVGLMVI